MSPKLPLVYCCHHAIIFSTGLLKANKFYCKLRTIGNVFKFGGPCTKNGEHMGQLNYTMYGIKNVPQRKLQFLKNSLVFQYKVYHGYL